MLLGTKRASLAFGQVFHVITRCS